MLHLLGLLQLRHAFDVGGCPAAPALAAAAAVFLAAGGLERAGLRGARRRGRELAVYAGAFVWCVNVLLSPAAPRPPDPDAAALPTPILAP